MSHFLYLLLMTLSVTQVFGGCRVCGAKGTEDQKASFCTNVCVVPDDMDTEDPLGPAICELQKNETSCGYDKLRPKGHRCVQSVVQRVGETYKTIKKECYFQDLELDATEDHECGPPDNKCAQGRGHCNQCEPCFEGIHTELLDLPGGGQIYRTTVDKNPCYMAQIGNANVCVFNYYDNKMKVAAVDYCEPPPFGFEKVCEPYILTSTDGGDRGYIYEEISEGITWLDAQALCKDMFNADPATIIYEADIQKALEYIGFGPPPWIGTRSTDSDLDFSPVDCTECPVFHHGHSCRGCTEKSLWQNGLPIKEGGSHCVRLVPEDATITNDVDCDDILYAVLCNCDDTASLDCEYVPPYPYNT